MDGMCPITAALCPVHTALPHRAAFEARPGLMNLARPWPGCSSRQRDVLVVPSSTGWCLMQAHPTPLCLSTSGTRTSRTTPVWSARPFPVTSRVSIPWARACVVGGLTWPPSPWPAHAAQDQTFGGTEVSWPSSEFHPPLCTAQVVLRGKVSSCNSASRGLWWGPSDSSCPFWLMLWFTQCLEVAGPTASAFNFLGSALPLCSLCSCSGI